jgi:hypothetical protein
MIKTPVNKTNQRCNRFNVIQNQTNKQKNVFCIDPQETLKNLIAFQHKNNGVTRGMKIRSKSKEELDFLYESHCSKVNLKFDKILQKNPKKNVEQERYLELKRCEKCLDFINDKLMLLCDICDDGYHMYCLEPQVEKISEQEFICPRCKKEKKFKQSKIDEKLEIKIKRVNKVKIIIN